MVRRQNHHPPPRCGRRAIFLVLKKYKKLIWKICPRNTKKQYYNHYTTINNAFWTIKVSLTTKILFTHARWIMKWCTNYDYNYECLWNYKQLTDDLCFGRHSILTTSSWPLPEILVRWQAEHIYSKYICIWYRHKPQSILLRICICLSDNEIIGR